MDALMIKNDQTSGKEGARAEGSLLSPTRACDSSRKPMTRVQLMRVLSLQLSLLITSLGVIAFFPDRSHWAAGLIFLTWMLALGMLIDAKRSGPFLSEDR